ncbi:MAG: TPM domain-containing protein [Archangium sp.]|nr:TPM domain-containing protein [Archangium sp.]
MRSLIAVALFSVSAVAATPWEIKPPPRGQWILDQTGKVSASTLETINRTAEALDQTGTGQLGVLVVETTSGMQPRNFATEVFNKWGVGHSGANDGILLFFALTDRKSEIVLGDGSKVSSTQTDAVMATDVVANMKRGNLNAAILSASHSLIALMAKAGGIAIPSANDNTGLGGDTYVTPTYAPPARDEVLSAYAEGSKSFPERSPRTWVIDTHDVLTPSQRAQLDVAASDIYSSNKGRIFFLVVKSAGSYPTLDQLSDRLLAQVKPLSSSPAAVIALDVGNGTAKIDLPVPPANEWERIQVSQAESSMRSYVLVDRLAALLGAQRFVQTAMTSGIPARPMSEVLQAGYYRHKTELLVGGAIAVIVALFWLRRWNRKRIRICEDCKQPRQLLNDDAEDEYLDKAQKVEESIKSVDYDVWWCEPCDDVLVLRYGAFFSSYSSCTSCSAKTLKSTCTTLERATEWSGGLERIDERCVNCSYTNSYTRRTARIQSSSRSSSSWSSSSSSRSSFGGGRSSGGGSSGSW